MAIAITRGESDEIIDQFVEALRNFEIDHPKAKIDLYRHTPVSVRIRIIDPDFAKLDKPERHKRFWKYLEPLSDTVQSDICSLVLLTPKEAKTSIVSMAFDDPIPYVFVT